MTWGLQSIGIIVAMTDPISGDSALDAPNDRPIVLLNKVDVTLTTHDAGGLSLKDMKMAKAIGSLL